LGSKTTHVKVPARCAACGRLLDMVNFTSWAREVAQLIARNNGRCPGCGHHLQQGRLTIPE